MLKKKGNCNVVATWFHHVISLVIPSNDIPLNLPIALTYCLIPDGSLFWYTKPHLSIIGNRLPILHCWEVHKPLSHLLRSPLAAILFVGKRSLHYPTAVLISTHQYPIDWDATFFDSISLGFGSPLIALQLWADDAFINLFLSQVGGLRCGGEASSIHTKL